MWYIVRQNFSLDDGEMTMWRLHSNYTSKNIAHSLRTFFLAGAVWSLILFLVSITILWSNQ
jgi:hypothetical protein